MKVGGGIAPPARAAGRVRRRTPKRPALAARVARGALELTMLILMVAGIATAGTSTWAYFQGKADGRAAMEKQASDERAKQEKEHREAMDKLRADARAKFEAALLDAAARYDATDTARREAQRALALEQATTRRLRDERDAARTLAADAGRMRDEAIARAATGGVTEAEDSTAACRARADALGRAMGEVLRGYRACSLDLEDAGGGTRALMRWAGAVESSERAEAVAP